MKATVMKIFASYAHASAYGWSPVGLLLAGVALAVAACGAPESNGNATPETGAMANPAANVSENAAASADVAMNHDAMDHAAMDSSATGADEHEDAAAPESAAVLFAEEIFGGNSGDYGMVFAPDGRTIFFTRAMPTAGSEAIYFTRLVAGQWSEPEPASFSGRFHDREPYVSPDGNRVYFASRRPLRGRAQKQDFDIWYVERRGENWSDPVRVDAVSSPYNDDYPAVSADGTLVFARNDDSGNVDLWIAYGSSRGLVTPRVLGRPINTVFAEADPWIAPDGRFIIFSSPQISPDARGQGDLYVIHRRGEAWTRPASLGVHVNSFGHEYGAALSPDGATFFFSRGLGGQVWTVPASFLESLNGF